MLPRFDVHQPASVDEACGLLRRHSAEGAAVLAGGTDLLVGLRRPIVPEHAPRCKGCATRAGRIQETVVKPPAHLIALSRIPELMGITRNGNGEISVGATTTITEVCESPLIRENLPALAEGCDNLGSPLVRNRGTIGGNVCSARPAADALLPSVALGCKLELRSTGGTRTVPVEEFVTGPGMTVRQPDEILVRLIYPVPGGRSGGAFRKLGGRKALDIALVNVASVLTLDEGGKIAEARIALGAVGPTPILAEKAAEFLKGKTPSEKVFDEAGGIAAGECRPITDHRGSEEYRREVVPILVKRTLAGAAESALAKK